MDARELVERLHAELLGSRDLAVLERFFATFQAAFPDATVRVDEVVADGDRAAVATTIEGTHDGELLGIAPTGRRVSVCGIDLVRVAGGRIVEHRGLTDTVGLLRQLSGG